MLVFLNTDMKNYWIQQYRKKKAQFWTVEFARNGLFLLQPRQAGCVAPTASDKRSSVIFFDSMFNKNDNELLDFLTEIHQKGMKNIYARYRHYRSLTAPTEFENFELTDLSYDSLGTGPSVDDIKLTFSFVHLRRYAVGN